MFYEISCKSLTTELLLNSKKHRAFHPLPSDVEQREEKKDEEEQDRDGEVLSS